MGLWDKIFGKKKDAVAANPRGAAAACSLDAFVMGVNIEEIYIIFGEQIQTQMGGLPHNLYASAERKLKAIREVLAKLGLPEDLSAALTPIKARIERGMGARSQTPDEVSEAMMASMKTAEEIGRLMGAIRGKLDDLSGLQYDLGIFTARLSLCCRMIRASAALTGNQGAPMRDLYAKEFRRGGQQFARILAAGVQAGVFERAFPDEFGRGLAAVGSDVAKDSSCSPEFAAGVEKRIEDLLAKAGFSAVRPDL